MQNLNGYYDNENSVVAETQTMLDSAVYDYDADYDILTDSEIYSEQLKALLPQKRYAHPLLVLALLIVCFPVGLTVMLCFTKWGAFPKALITIFVLAVVVAIYEILVAKQVLLLPGLFEMLNELFTAQ